MKHNPDPAKQTEIEVHFVPDGRVRTRVDLEHRLLDRFASNAEQMRATFDSEAGWVGLLRRERGLVFRAALRQALTDQVHDGGIGQGGDIAEVPLLGDIA
jgi:hypothetical protein